MKRAVSILVLSLAAAGCATTPSAPIPAAIAPAAAEAHALTVGARGVQVYQCRAGKDGVHQWAFVAPDATLLDERGRTIGHHGAGPYWEAADGSRIEGSLKARADAPSAGAIPWLLLATKSTGKRGAFAGVTSVQRVNTEGGLAPKNGCAAETAGREVRVHYTADYRLFTKGS